MFENLDKRKLILLVGVGLAVVVLAWLLYLALRPAPAPVTPPVNEEPGVPGGLPPAGNLNINVNQPSVSTTPLFPSASTIAEGGVTAAPALTSGSTVEPFGTANGGARYYDLSTCQFYETQPNGERTTLSDAKYCSAQNVTWSPDGQSTVLEF